MIALGILLALVILIGYPLLFQPLHLHIDTLTGIYLLRWSGLASVRLQGGMEDPAIRVWALGWRRHWRLLDLAFQSKRDAREGSKPGKPRSQKKRKHPHWLTLRLLIGLLHTFRLRECRLQLDTGDYVQNAYWYPLFRAFSRGSRQLCINFQGRNELLLDISNRPADMLWVFVREKFRLKNRKS